MVYCLSCGRPPFRFGEENRRRAPRGPVVIEENRWAERESNPQSQRRLIYSHRQGLRERDANFLAIPKVSLGAGVDSAKGSVAHFVQHGAGRLTSAAASDRKRGCQTY